MREASVAPSATDPLARSASEVVGGPWGRHAGSGPVWLSALLVCLPAAVLAVGLGVLQKQHCRAEGWRSPDQFFHACYSDLPVVYTSSGLAEGAGPYAQGTALGQPPLTTALTWLVARVVGGGTSAADQRAYFDVAAVVVAVCLLLVVAGVLVAAGRRRWDAALVAASPLVVLTGLLSFDLLGVALATLGLAAWARRWPVAAGVLLGLAVAARTYPVLLLLGLGLLALRTGRFRAAATTAVAAVAAWLAVDVPLLLATDGAWSAYLRDWWSRPAGYGSPWLVPQLVEQAVGAEDVAGLSPGTVTALSLVAGAAVVVAVGVLVLWAPRRPRVPQVALLLVAGWLLVGKAVPPQASLWLLPLAALAVPRWRDHAAWLATEGLYFVAVWLFIAGQSVPDRGLPPEFYLAALVLRLAGIGWLVVAVVRDVAAPGRDPARAVGGARDVDDPAGGDFDGAPDALVVRIA
ncbi:glycosyltransferase family 87 protein [Kineococcus glutinatus]|uniref:Glycosyltransferase 87 family protein n=1 Tax=Kineococcus glutinatus TaxID=1070872 RepID=A0ABP9HWQ4_9ACTN